jgi:hypothetical protein
MRVTMDRRLAERVWARFARLGTHVPYRYSWCYLLQVAQLLTLASVKEQRLGSEGVVLVPGICCIIIRNSDSLDTFGQTWA